MYCHQVVQSIGGLLIGNAYYKVCIRGEFHCNRNFLERLLSTFQCISLYYLFVDLLKTNGINCGHRYKIKVGFPSHDILKHSLNLTFPFY